MTIDDHGLSYHEFRSGFRVTAPRRPRRRRRVSLKFAEGQLSPDKFKAYQLYAEGWRAKEVEAKTGIRAKTIQKMFERLDYEEVKHYLARRWKPEEIAATTGRPKRCIEQIIHKIQNSLPQMLWFQELTGNCDKMSQVSSFNGRVHMKKLHWSRDRKFLKEKRQELRLTQAGLAKLAKMKRSQIADIEAGRCKFGDAARYALWPALVDLENVYRRLFHVGDGVAIADGIAAYVPPERMSGNGKLSDLRYAE